MLKFSNFHFSAVAKTYVSISLIPNFFYDLWFIAPFDSFVSFARLLNFPSLHFLKCHLNLRHVAAKRGDLVMGWVKIWEKNAFSGLTMAQHGETSHSRPLYTNNEKGFWYINTNIKWSGRCASNDFPPSSREIQCQGYDICQPCIIKHT